MSRADAASRRLPGVRFVSQAPALPAVLPRMDVAALVGFSASGPLHVPVAVEDPGRFGELFGEDRELARDPRGGKAYAHLGPSVRAFLRNGGRRCWVVRVADETKALSNSFPLPGLLRFDSLGQEILRARSEGSWSDGLTVAAGLTGDGVEVQSLSLNAAGGADLAVRAPQGLVQGDLLELSFPGGILLYAPVDSFPTPEVVHSEAVAWVRTAVAPLLASSVLWNPGDGPVDIPLLSISGPVAGTWTADLPAPPASAPGPGAVVLIGGAFLTVRNLAQIDAGSRISGPVAAILTAAPAVDAAQAVCRRLSLSLRVSTPAGTRRLEGLGLCPLHPRYFGALPTDADLFGSELDETLDLRRDPLRAVDPREALWDEVSSPRFPLAGAEVASGFTIPLGLDALDAALGCARDARDPLDRDGLAKAGADLFLDPALAELSIFDLLAEADFIRWQSAEPRSLRGIHALLRVQEITLLAAPDAVQPGWVPSPVARPGEPAGEEAAAAEDPAAFRDCARVELTAPGHLAVFEPPPIAAGEPFTLGWDAVPGAESYSIEEAERADFLDAEEIATSSPPKLTIYGRDAGVHYFRVRALLSGRSGPASAGLALAVAPDSAWTLLDPRDPPDDLLAVQAALLRMACARGDLFALLSLPKGTLEDETVRHSALLRSTVGPGEEAALSYGALYHPWVVVSEESDPAVLRTLPPEGPCLGVLARRTLARGAWIAAANQPLTGVVALDPSLDEDRRIDLQDAQVNLVLPDPRGFLTLSEDTLSGDPDLLPIHVRRLLNLLKRAALRLGVSYVFEPNDRGFHRLVQRGFEDLLGTLFRRGAFSGKTPADGYQVVAGADPAGEDQGRFVVELKVAPAPALRLLTVRLVQTGGQGSVSEVA